MAEYGDEDLGLADFAVPLVDDLDCGAGVVDKQLVARRVGLAQYGVLGRRPGPLMVAEGAVFTAVWMRGAILLPQQHARDTLALELRLDVGEIRARECRCGALDRVQPGFQLTIGQLRCQRPRQPGLARTAQTFLYGRARHAQ